MENKVSKGVALFVTSVASFVTPFLGSSVNIALPVISKEFSMDALLVTWVTTAYYLSAAVFTVPFGRLADIKGRKKIFLTGITIYTVSALIATFATSGIMLISLRALQGFGSAMVFGTAIAILTSVFPPEERGKALGVNVTSTYVGLSLGPYVGGSLTQIFGWRSVFAVNVPLGLVLILLIIFKLRAEWAEAKGDPFDIPGTVFYGLSLVLTMYGVSSLPDIKATLFILLGVSAFAFFIFWEGRVKSPVLNISLFKENHAFTFSNLAALVNYSATHGVTFLMSLYLQNVKGFAPSTAGLILLTWPLTQAVLSPVTGRFSDRVQPKYVASAGMGLTLVSLVFFALITEETAVALIVANLIFLGFGLALFLAPNSNAIMGSVERKFYGVASGTLGTMRLTGQITSMGIIMLTFALFLGKVKITPEQNALFLKSARAAFGVFGGLSFLGVFASLKGGRGRKRK